MVRPARTARDRVGAGAGIVVGVGLLVYLYSVYHALEAGGLTTTSTLGACARAATGRVSTTYRLNEQLVVDRGFFPPSATCRWSGGSEAVLLAPTWTWSGIVLVAVGVSALVVLRLARRR